MTSSLKGLVSPSSVQKPFFKRAMLACYLLSVALIAGALWKWGAVEIRGQGGEVFFLTLVGVVWVVVLLQVFSWFGLCINDDIFERQNPAAFIALAGATFAVAIIYAGGSLGEGPSYWNNIFSAGIGTVGLFFLWFWLELVGRVSVSIAEERDLAAGIRFGTFMLAVGLILARAVAGNWHSESTTIQDFTKDGWPAAALCALAIVVERILRPSRTRPFPGWLNCGLLPGLAYLLCGCLWVFHLGRWEGMPR